MGICIKEALRIIKSNITKISYDMVPIEDSNKKIIAQDIYAKYPLPSFNNSAVDGYGVKLCDEGEIVKVDATQCIKIMTGERVPSTVEAVVPFELVDIIDDDHIRVPTGIEQNQHIRFAGEDIQKNEKILSEGDEINFSAITILASQGVTHIKVYKKPKVSVLTSEEELKLHYEEIENYQIFNSNTPTLLSRVKELGCDVNFEGLAQDGIELLQQMIENSPDVDFIITTGGMSVGEANFTQEVFEQFEMDILFNGIGIKPEKPTIFGKLGNTYILNLPGNPLAASLIFEVFGTIIIQKLSGSKNIFHNYISTKLSEDLKNKKGKTTIIPGWFDGDYFIPSKKRFPGMVGVLHKCNSMIILNKDTTGLLKDDIVKVIPINWKFYTDIQKDFFN